jgi:hypothetical protein
MAVKMRIAVFLDITNAMQSGRQVLPSWRNMLFRLQDRRYGRSRKGGLGIWTGRHGMGTGNCGTVNIRGKIKQRKESWVRHSEETLKIIPCLYLTCCNNTNELWTSCNLYYSLLHKVKFPTLSLLPCPRIVKLRTAHARMVLHTL